MFRGSDRVYLDRRFDRLEKMIRFMMESVLTAEEMTMATVQELNDAVAELTVSVDAAVTAIGSAGTSGIDPAELDAAVASIKEQAKKLNDAVHAAQM
jgi:hypothetical protein